MKPLFAVICLFFTAAAYRCREKNYGSVQNAVEKIIATRNYQSASLGSLIRDVPRLTIAASNAVPVQPGVSIKTHYRCLLAFDQLGLEKYLFTTRIFVDSVLQHYSAITVSQSLYPRWVFPFPPARKAVAFCGTPLPLRVPGNSLRILFLRLFLRFGCPALVFH